MQPSEIEAWATRILLVVEKGGRVEDSRVELKAIWPIAVKAARQVAGHANAAQGDPILWIIGADEDGTIAGADDIEISDWHKTFVAQFDEPAPHFTEVIMTFAEKRVVAVQFDTDRPPYVVKVDGAVSREVPYRQGTHVNSANRSQLMRLLAPVVSRPVFEPVRGSGKIISPIRIAGQDRSYHTSVLLRVFAVQPANQQLVLISHRAQVRIVANGRSFPIDRVLFQSLSGSASAKMEASRVQRSSLSAEMAIQPQLKHLCPT